MTALVRGGVCTLAVLIYPAIALAWPPAMLVPPEGVAVDHFPRPDKLAGAIDFWSAVFARHASNRVVIHDRDDMSVIWQVLELPSNEDGTVDERNSSDFVRSAVDELRARLKRLSATHAPIDEEDAVLLALVGGADSPYLEGAHERLRTQRGVADHFRLGLERARQWLPTVREILVSEGVPAELAALPFIESTFNPLARSSAGAAGLWQLMPGTARQFGLHVARGNDERLDVVKATRVAARVLRQNYDMLGTWPLAITGYNHGPYGMRRAVKEVGSTDIVYLIENHKKQTWGFASKNFYAEFLAVLRVLEESEASTATAATESGPDTSLR
jgi:membrane-bound lytic murein transglycosylase D